MPRCPRRRYPPPKLKPRTMRGGTLFDRASGWTGRLAIGLSVRAQATVLACFALRRLAAGSTWDDAAANLYDVTWTLIGPLAWAPLALWVIGAAGGCIAFRRLPRLDLPIRP